MLIKDFISVIIPTHNRSARLVKAIASVRSQVDVKLEIIVVDDASSDDTSQIIRLLCQEEPRLRYICNEQSLGGGYSRNVGARLARGEFIAFLDDDDKFISGKLVKQITALRANPSSPAVSCSFEIFLEGRRSSVIKIQAPKNRQQLLCSNILGGASVCMVRTQCFHAVGGFNPSLPSCQDWDLWLKLDRLGPIISHEEPLVIYIIHSDPRITGNARHTYAGRRYIHNFYGKEMNYCSRRRSICALVYYRNIIYADSIISILRGLLVVIRLAQGLEKLLYLLRAFRLWAPALLLGKSIN